MSGSEIVVEARRRAHLAAMRAVERLVADVQAGGEPAIAGYVYLVGFLAEQDAVMVEKAARALLEHRERNARENSR